MRNSITQPKCVEWEEKLFSKGILESSATGIAGREELDGTRSSESGSKNTWKTKKEIMAAKCY